MSLTLYLVTQNQGKLQEVREILSPYRFKLESAYRQSRITPVEETGQTYAENALLKAQAGFEALGGIVLGEDSGLEIDVLEGAPGLYSARFAGELASAQGKNARILELLQEVPSGRRSARFVCMVALVWEGGKKLFQGICEGEISLEPRGTEGFGYDPIFILPPFGKTLAELGPTVKNRLSHRAQAFKKCADYICSQEFRNPS